jgi:DNA excision repair protein ERCC-4
MAALSFYDDVDRDLRDADTLVVLAGGLGIAHVLARFVAAHVRPGRLILGLNIQREVAVNVIWPAVIRAAATTTNGLAGDSTGGSADPALLLPRFVNADYSVKDRSTVYSTGGFVIASSTVLVHDLLMRNLPTDSVDGLVVFAADRVRSSSNTHFALTLFRMHNRVAFIKALSENAPALTLGFHHAEKVMRTLFVSRLSNWPRFHTKVKSSLSRRTPDLIDLSVPLAPSQAAVITSLREIASRVLNDLRLACRTLDISDIYRTRLDPTSTGPAILVSNFDDVVRRQLTEVPGQRFVSGGEKIRSLVADLTTIRALLTDAVDLNPIIFYQHILTLRHTQTRATFWLMRRESQSMLVLARSRIWVRRKASSTVAASESHARLHAAKRPRLESKGNASIEFVVDADATALADEATSAVENDGDDVITVPVLDPSPKWGALIAVIEEIEGDVRQIGRKADVSRVLIAVKDQAALDELRQVLTIGAKPYMRRLFRSVLPAIAQDSSWEETAIGKETRHGGDVNNELQQLTMTQITGCKGMEERENIRSGSGLAESAGAQRHRLTSSRGGKRDRAAHSDYLFASAQSRQKVEEDTRPWPWPVRPLDDVDKYRTGLEGLDSYFGLATVDNPAKGVQVLLWCLEWTDAQGRGKRLLEEYRPSFVVMYNADIAFVRQVEVYKAETPGRPLRLYLLAYEDAVDEDRYRNAIVREQSAFKSLIKDRASMVVHADQEGRAGSRLPDAFDPIAGYVGAGRALGTDRDSRASGLARSQGQKQHGGTVIVDTRELRSALPMMLFECGLTITPVTLEVGDFVLSDNIAIERKSVPDLYGSFTSGRLFNQAEAMCRHYSQACLMIELEESSRLSLAVTSGGVPSEIVPASIISKMVLLIQQFPDLRLLWAKGPHDAAQLFGALKRNEEEPDAERAAALGVDSAEGADTTFNSLPATFLRSLPGIDGSNMLSVMRKVRNVSALLNLSLVEMTVVLGNQGKAKKLHEFANEVPSEALAAL